MKHYAGTVAYNVQNWLSKNMNPLTDDIIDLMRSSSVIFVAELFPKLVIKKEGCVMLLC